MSDVIRIKSSQLGITDIFNFVSFINETSKTDQILNVVWIMEGSMLPFRVT